MAPTATKTLSQEEQTILVNESLSNIKQQTIQMRKCLDTKGKLMDALKHASTFLSELRTNNLSPKNYYELYIAIYDSLEILAYHLKEGHPRNHLSNLYELVQYAGNIVPRLYLMITVGTVYMSVDDAPVKEIMKDMIEMCRGVQHPVRGLFLRYYLSQRTKSLLPESAAGPPSSRAGGSGNGNGNGGSNGTLQDSVQFIITNFIEMNKLWVRLQHQGHSKERRKRIQERQELQILVGSNLVRLSQLDGVDKNYYKSYILPAILEQIIQCRDMIAQEYLLDVIIQVFPDEFHLATLKQFLDSTVNLIPQVSLKKILITLLDRLTNYVDRENLEGFKKLAISNDENANQEKLKEKGESDAEDGKERAQEAEQKEKQADEQQFLADEVSENVAANYNNLFDIFYQHFKHLNKVRPDLTIDDLTALYFALLKLSLSFYPDNFENIDLIYTETLNRYNDFKDTIESSNDQTEENLRNILLIPLNFSSFVNNNNNSNNNNNNNNNNSASPAPNGLSGTRTSGDRLSRSSTSSGSNSKKNKINLKLLLKLQNYQALLSAQSLKVQVSISTEILNTLLNYKFTLENEEEIAKVFQVLQPIILNKNPKTTAEDLQVDRLASVGVGENSAAELGESTHFKADHEYPYETLVKQENVAKLIHLIYNRDAIANGKLLSAAYLHLNKNKRFIKFLYPSLVFAYLKTIRRLHTTQRKFLQNKGATFGGEKVPLSQKDITQGTKVLESEIKTNFGKISKLADELVDQGELELALKLLVSVAEISNQIGKNEFTNEFFIKIFSIYEELLSSKQQYQIIMQLISTLIGFYKNFHHPVIATAADRDNYESLITKTVLYSAKLLKKSDQCRAVFSASHLWFQSNVLALQSGTTASPANQNNEAATGDEADKTAKNSSSGSSASTSTSDNRRVLECLQKSLRIADSCIESSVSVELFVEILNECIYYYIHGNLISANYINSLIELINNNLASVDELPINHFKRTLEYISRQKVIDDRFQLIKY